MEIRVNGNKISGFNIERIEQAGFTKEKVAADGAKFRKGNLTVIISAARELDGKIWIHVSLARPNKNPTWEEIKYIKKVFLGEDVKAIIILSKKENYVNLHHYCFHLWHCVDGDGLPDFDRGMGTI